MKLNSITYKNRNTPIFDWQNHFCCDSNAMRNIERQERHNRSGIKFDDLSYKYQKDGNGNLQRNRLYHVNDAIASSLDSTDIDDMGAFISAVNQINTDNNYSYDAEGRLVKDKQEEIDTILWTVTGKVREIHRIDTSKKKNLVFDYDAFGRRIAKHVYNNETSMLEKSTYYILDASGNQLSIYEHRIDTANNAATYYLTERNIYGSSRLGVVNDTVNLFVPTLLPSYGIVGNRTYELSNHLGNVLTVINDIKYPVSDDNVSISGFEVGIAGISDYSPFGAPLDGRTIQNSNYRYGFQAQEKDDEIKGAGNSVNYTFRMHDPRLGRFFAVDPLEMNFPWNSPYAFSENRVIDAIEMEGLELVLVHGTWASRNDRKTGALQKADYKGGSTWKKELGEGLGSATGWSTDQTFEYSWSGINKAYNRKEAAKTLAAKLMNSEINPDADKKHVTLVGHSHGGNVNKEVQKILRKKGWTVDIINISTPQRLDHQSTSDAKENGVYLNFYYGADAIQYEGTGDNGHSSSNTGPWGARKDQNADRNIAVDNIYNNSQGADWWASSGGHSIHKNTDVINFIIEKVYNAFYQEFKKAEQTQQQKK